MKTNFNRREYRNKISFLTNSELIREYESVSELASYTSDPKWRLKKDELINELTDRKLAACI